MHGVLVSPAIGAKLGEPDSPVVALAGDGAFPMTGLEMLRADREGVGVIVLVLRDRDLSQISQFQERGLSRKVASRIVDYDLEARANGLGVEALSMDSDEDVPKALASAAAVAEAGTHGSCQGDRAVAWNTANHQGRQCSSG